MKKILLLLLIGSFVNASGTIPIIYFTDNGNFIDYCVDNKTCMYNDMEIKEEKNILYGLIPLLTIIAFSLILLYLIIYKISDLNGYKKILNP